MLLFFLVARMIMSGGGTQIGETDSCDPNELKLCVQMIPRTPIGLPKNKADLDAHCRAYHTGMSCMDVWIKRCLPTDGQKFVQQQIGGARALMRFLCSNETALRRDFLRETTCWKMVSPEWSHCVDELQIAVRDIVERSQQLAYINKNSELCCAREDFVSCVAHAGRSCSDNAATLLRRMAWVLAQDVAACSQHAPAYCAASLPYAAPLLTLTGIILYQARF
ncbi:unnamed protein product, partial [Iphiclides podalirius]